MINKLEVVIFIPSELGEGKRHLFAKLGQNVARVIRGDVKELERLGPEWVPAIGCTGALGPMVREWLQSGRRFIYWDRGYARRKYSAGLPQGAYGGYYRWHLNSFQMTKIRRVPSDRWDALRYSLAPWKKSGEHIVVAEPSANYETFHSISRWTEQTVERLKALTDRKIVCRAKTTKTPLSQALLGAHAMVTHGSNAAVEAVIMGCPVFVDKTSAAALVGSTDLSKIETPVYPDRVRWAHSLAYCQFSESEMLDGSTLWRLIE